MRCARFRSWTTCVKETLRLHPPLIILMRVAKDEFEVAGLPDPQGRLRRRVAGDLATGSPRTSPTPTRSTPTATTKPRQEDLANRWTWIPFGAGKHRCVGAAFAADADQGDLLGAVARVRVRDVAARRQLPERPLQDGRAAGSARQGALPQARPKDAREETEVMGCYRVELDAGPVPGPRHVRTGGPGRVRRAQARRRRDPRRTNHPTTSARTSSGRSKCVPPKQCPSQDEGGLTMASFRAAAGRLGRAVAQANRDCRGGGRLEAAGRLLHRRRHLRLEHRPQGRRHVRRHATRSATSHWVWRWRAWRTGSTSTRRCWSTRSRARSSASGSRSSTRPTAPRTRSTASAAAGSGSTTELLIEWQRDFFDFGHVAYMFVQAHRVRRPQPEGMQKRIERSVAGEKLPGYYPLGEAPSRSGELPAKRLLGGACDAAN